MKKVTIALMLFLCLIIIGVNAPVKAVFASVEGMEFESKSAYLIDYNSNEVLFAYKENEKLPVASIVKLMTILLTLENIESGKLSLDDIITISSNAAGMGGSQVFIDAGSDYAVGEMLKSVIIASANDASVALAETIAGSEEAFVELMNRRAKELNLTGTNYANATGLPASDQFSTARDIALLLKEVSGHEIYHKYSTIWMDTLKHKNNRESELVNTNKLIRYYSGCDGGKTGSTSEAGFCLSATAKRGEMRIIGVVLGAKDSKIRFAETSKLLNYGFNNFENKKVVSNDEEIENSIKVLSGKQNKVSVVSKNDLFMLTRKNADKNYEIKIDLNKTLKAPVKKGDVAGRVYVIKDGTVIAESSIICTCNIERATIIDNIMKSVNNWEIAK